MINSLYNISRAVKKDKYHYFFGYYDKNPWSFDETKLLAHRVSFINKFPDYDDVAEIGYINLKNSEFYKLDITTAWNWQQGAQLQWLNPKEEIIIYNVKVDKKVRGCIYNIKTKEKQILNDSIYSISQNYKYGLTLSYSRLFLKRKDYGIAGISKKSDSHNCPKEDGIYKIDFLTNKVNLIVSLDKIAKFENNKLFNSSYNRLNHIMINPSGDKFCFLNRVKNKDGIDVTRLFTADKDGNNLKLIFEGMVSHFDWMDDENLIAWAGKRKLITQKSFLFSQKIKKILFKIFNIIGKPKFLKKQVLGDTYMIINTKNNKIKKLNNSRFYSDGHCTFNKNNKLMLSDAYPNNNNKQPLFLFSFELNKYYDLGRYYTPPHLKNELRVDLHPRFNRLGDKICIDSAMDGSRSIYIIKVNLK